MATLKNTLGAAITVHGKVQYDIAPGQAVKVDDETAWKDHPYVKCGALELEAAKPKGKSKDENPA